MTVNTTGVTPAANFIPEIWVPEVSDASQAATVASSLVDRRYEQYLSMGDTVHIQDSSNPDVRLKTEDTLATYANITETKQDIQVTRHAYTGFLIEKIAEYQSSISLRSMYTNKSGYSLTAYIEGNATNGLVSLGSGFSQSVGVLGQDPTYDQLVSAWQKLADRDVPEGERYFIATPAIYAAMLKMDMFIKENYVGSDAARTAIQKAKLGRVLDTDVYMTSLWNANPAAAGQGYGWFCHKDGVALIVQQDPQVNAQWDLTNFGWGVMVDTFYQFAEREIAPSTLGGGSSDDKFNVSVCGS